MYDRTEPHPLAPNLAPDRHRRIHLDGLAEWMKAQVRTHPVDHAPSSAPPGVGVEGDLPQEAQNRSVQTGDKPRLRLPIERPTSTASAFSIVRLAPRLLQSCCCSTASRARGTCFAT
jgi:hypothetical protein